MVNINNFGNEGLQTTGKRPSPVYFAIKFYLSFLWPCSYKVVLTNHKCCMHGCTNTEKVVSISIALHICNKSSHLEFKFFSSKQLFF